MVEELNIWDRLTRLEKMLRGTSDLEKEVAFLIGTTRSLLDDNFIQMTRIHNLEALLKREKSNSGMNAVDFNKRFSEHHKTSLVDNQEEFINDFFEIVLNLLVSDNVTTSEIREALIEHLDNAK